MKQGILCIEDKVKKKKERLVGREKAEKTGLVMKRVVGADK